ncbi:MAG: hypothetical protein HQL54_11475 [Magnetococcales bacterium]|nr:hypothetical protein [Magnetococcales bacterium]
MSTELIDTLKNHLTEERELSHRMATRIINVMEVDNPLEGLKPERLEALDEFEVERLLSGAFTPVQEDRAKYQRFVPVVGLEKSKVAEIGTDLINNGLTIQLRFGDDADSIAMPEVVLDRFLRLLHLDRPINAGLAERIADWNGPDGDMVRSLLRLPVWQDDDTVQILDGCLDGMEENQSRSLDKVRFLSEFITSTRPDDLMVLAEQLHNLLDAYKKDEDHPMFNFQLGESQSNSIRSKFCGDHVKAFRLAMAVEILKDLGEIE